MPIAFFCPTCGKGHAVGSQHAGRAARCACGRMIDVPMRSEPPPLPRGSMPPPLPPLPSMATATPPVAWPVRPPVARVPWRIVAWIGSGVAVCLCLSALAFFARPIPQVALAATPAARVRTASVDATLANPSPPAIAMRTRRGFDAGFAEPTVIATTPAAPRTWPADAEWTTPVPGVREMRVTVDSVAGQKTHLQIYLPTDTAAGVGLPCVFIAPAGSRLFHGMALSDGDTPEHLPYVRAGFAVVAYSLSGPLPADKRGDREAVQTAYREFSRSSGGLSDAQAAMDYAIARRPEIDRDRFYAAGHSSAGTVALLVASRDARIRGCCAYAPVVDVEKYFETSTETLGETLFALHMFAHRTSPIAQPKPRGKVMIFHADDDTTVPAADLRRYVDHVGAELVTVPTGKHYRSMIDAGIPAGIAFLRGLAANPAKP